MSGWEAKPQSPERLSIRKIDFAGMVDGVPMVQATFAYDTWCCSDFHEVMDAIETLQKVIEDASDRAYKKRTKVYQEQMKGLVDESGEL